MTLRTGWAILALAAGGCGGKLADGPPEVRLGRDECAACGMIISDERSVCARLVERDGRREHELFDDAGCMLDHEREEAGVAGVGRAFVRDYTTREWIDAGSATYLMTDPGALRTPMGSGIGAFADRAGAERAKAELGGEVLDSDGVARARRALVEARGGGGAVGR